MIYEVRTYDIKPRSLKEVEKRFGEKYEQRKKYSELFAFWHTEIGPLNQIIHVWKYKDLAERAQIRAAAVNDKAWPPPIGEFIVDQKSEIFIPFQCSPEIKPGKYGPYFEIRTYAIPAGGLPRVIKQWEDALPARQAVSPLLAVWHNELGAVNTFVHIWPYPSMDARAEARRKSEGAGIWPPAVVAEKKGEEAFGLLRQENKIVMPSAFSPIQ